MTANTTDDKNAATEMSLRNQVIAAAGWLGGWAVACAAMFGLRFGKIWNVVGGTWLGLVIAYLVLFFGGALIFFTFSKLDRIQSEGLKFLAQMFLCLIFATVAGGIILVLSF